MYSRNRFSAGLIFMAVFICAFIVQWQIWHALPIIDHTLWENRIKHFAEDLTRRPIQFIIHDTNGYRYSGHPGMTLTTIGGLVITY